MAEILASSREEKNDRKPRQSMAKSTLNFMIDVSIENMMQRKSFQVVSFALKSVLFAETSNKCKMENQEKSKSGMGEVFSYFFRKNDPERPSNFNIKAMHTINKISILMFLVGIVMLIIKLSLR